MKLDNDGEVAYATRDLSMGRLHMQLETCQACSERKLFELFEASSNCHIIFDSEILLDWTAKQIKG